MNLVTFREIRRMGSNWVVFEEKNFIYGLGVEGKTAWFD